MYVGDSQDDQILFVFVSNKVALSLYRFAHTDRQNTSLEEEYRIIVIFPKLSTVSW